VPPDDMSCENAECAAHLKADSRRRSSERHSGLQISQATVWRPSRASSRRTPGSTLIP
jgi:hypothetical protein